MPQVGCYTANQRFGRTLVAAESVDALARVPTLLVLTEKEDAADVAENETLSARLAGAEAGGARAPHLLLKYAEEARVPHPMVSCHVDHKVSGGDTLPSRVDWHTLIRSVSVVSSVVSAAHDMLVLYVSAEDFGRQSCVCVDSTAIRVPRIMITLGCVAGHGRDCWERTLLPVGVGFVSVKLATRAQPQTFDTVFWLRWIRWRRARA